MMSHGIKWPTVMACASMYNARAERIVRTLKSGTGKVVRDGGDWDEALHNCVFGYGRRPGPSEVAPFELLRGVKPRKMGTEGTNPPPAQEIGDRSMETLNLAIFPGKRPLGTEKAIASAPQSSNSQLGTGCCLCTEQPSRVPNGRRFNPATSARVKSFGQSIRAMCFVYCM